MKNAFMKHTMKETAGLQTNTARVWKHQHGRQGHVGGGKRIKLYEQKSQENIGGAEHEKRGGQLVQKYSKEES